MKISIFIRSRHIHTKKRAMSSGAEGFLLSATTHDTRNEKKERVEKSENVYYLGTETEQKKLTKLGNIAAMVA